MTAIKLANTDLDASHHRNKAVFMALFGMGKKLGQTLLAAILSLAIVFPFAWVIFTAVKSRRELPLNPLGVPFEWHWENFIQAWKVGHFDRYFMNSVYVAIPTVTAILVLSTLAASRPFVLPLGSPVSAGV